MRTSKKLVMMTAVALAALVPGTAAHADPADSQLTTVSRGDPFADCAIGAVDGSVLYPGAEVEPSVATNGSRPSQVVAAWQQDRWNDGGARGLVAGFSTNGGRSFQEVSWPVSRCAGGLPYERASDPWVSIGPDGTVYGSALSFDATTPRNALVATTSYNGGRTWRNTTEVIADTSIQFFNDKNSVTADPVRAGSAYQVWDRLDLGEGGNELVTGPTMLSTTRDSGQTWGTPQAIVHTAAFQQTIGNVIVADPVRGTLYDFYTSLQFTDATASVLEYARYEVVRSTDAGRTWSQPSVVAQEDSVVDTDPNTGAPLRTEAGLASQAVDPRTGELYMVYEGADFSRSYNQAELVHSTDGGRTWSGPVRVSRDTGVTAFTPTVAVTEDGDVGVTYYDLRTLRPGNRTTLPTSTWLTLSPRGGTRFGHERQTGPVFDYLKAPFVSGYFLGDYQGLVASGDRFRALFVTANSDNSQFDNGTDVRYGQFRSFDSDQERAGSTDSPQLAASAATSAQARTRLPLLLRRRN